MHPINLTRNVSLKPSDSIILPET